jgi:membrane-bound ClpP family serine protease
MLLQYWLDIPVWFVFCVIALWILKEVALFPLVWQAYDADERRVAISMIGARGVAKQPLAPSGYVRVRGELWRAEVLGRGTPVEAGEVIRVREIHGLTLRVEPEQDR